MSGPFRPRGGAWSLSALPAALTMVVGLWRLDGAALWADELATWGAARLSLPDLTALLGTVDAALGPYYLLMWLWVGLAGDSEIALRLPSVVAVAATAGLITALGRRLYGTGAALVAGLLFAVLPSVSRFGQEARPYALVMLCAVLSTYLLVRAGPRPSAGRLAGYAASVAALGLLHLMSLLLLGGHGVGVLWAAYRLRRAGGRTAPEPAVGDWTVAAGLPLRWLAAAAVGVVPTVPLAVVAGAQTGQLSWIPDAPWQAPLNSPGTLFGVAVGGLIAVLAVLAWSTRPGTVLLVGCALAPVAVLAVASLGDNVWVVRYLLFTVPAWVLLAGHALSRHGGRLAAAALVATLALGLPEHARVRRADGHGQDSRRVQQVIGPLYRPGDALVFVDRHPSVGWSPRDAVARYLDPDRAPADVCAGGPQRTGGRLLATEHPDPAGCLAGASRLWLVRADRPAEPSAGLPPARARVVREQFQARRTWHYRLLTIVLLERRESGSG